METSFHEQTFKIENPLTGKLTIKLEIKTKPDQTFSDTIARIVSPNSVSDNELVQIKNNSTSVGMVFYAEKKYESPEEEKHNHIPFAEVPQLYPQIIAKISELGINRNPTQVIVGHEHGDKNSRCHLQTCLLFDKPITQILNPGRITVIVEQETSFVLLFMQQKGRNSKALQTYCKKAKNYTTLKPEIQEQNQPKGNPYATLLSQTNEMDRTEAELFLKNKTPRDYFTSFSNVQKALDVTFFDKLPPFEWKQPYIPENLTVYATEKIKLPFSDIFNKWFNDYCLKEGAYRRKALCLFSHKRNMGKSCFARSLVNDQRYLLEFNNTFCETKIGNGEHSPRLLLLDDMTDITPQTAQCWKSLIASQKTTIRGAYVNKLFNYSLPCIITTNSRKILTIMTLDPLYNTQVVLVEIENFMGPPNTYKKAFNTVERFLSPTSLEIAKMEEIKIEKEKETKKKLFSLSLD